MNHVNASYRRYRQALAKINAGNKAALFDVLDAAKITEVVAEFDGKGDQGQIDRVTASRDSARNWPLRFIPRAFYPLARRRN